MLEYCLMLALVGLVSFNAITSSGQELREAFRKVACIQYGGGAEQTSGLQNLCRAKAGPQTKG